MLFLKLKCLLVYKYIWKSKQYITSCKIRLQGKTGLEKVLSHLWGKETKGYKKHSEPGPASYTDRCYQLQLIYSHTCFILKSWQWLKTSMALIFGWKWGCLLPPTVVYNVPLWMITSEIHTHSDKILISIDLTLAPKDISTALYISQKSHFYAR